MRGAISKSRFKARALQYFRELEATGREIIITDRGRPVARIVPYTGPTEDPLEQLRGTVIRYDQPTEPVGLEDWESLH